MTEAFYHRISEPFRRNPFLLKLLQGLNYLFTAAGYISYPVLLGYLLRKYPERLTWNIILPAAGFVLLSLYRKYRNCPRPYEALHITPLMVKDTRGNSFPSRHVFSLCLIAACWYQVSVPVGVLLSVEGLLLGCIRVIGGVHFPKDVIVGAILGHLWGFLLFWF